MKKNLWQLVLPLVLVVLTLVIYALATREKEKEPGVVRVEQGLFEIIVSGTGELEAMESTNITIPDVLEDRSVRIRSIAINDIVREGTVVAPGDYVATLDPGDVEERIRSTEDAFEMYRNNLDNAKIDSSLVLVMRAMKFVKRGIWFWIRKFVLSSRFMNRRRCNVRLKLVWKRPSGLLSSDSEIIVNWFEDMRCLLSVLQKT